MPAVRLTQRRVDALRPRRKMRDVRDAELKGYGVRVMPSGTKRYFVHAQNDGRREWKTVGDAATLTEAEARVQARAILAALRDGGEPDATDPGETPFEAVAEEVFDRYGRRENSNPCKGIRRYRPGRSERFLSPEEYRRLGQVLDNHEASRPLHVAAVRLLLFTGCRKSEILTLEWRFYRDGNLHLADSKTGPRTVWLCQSARDVLDGLPRRARFVFPMKSRRTARDWLAGFWSLAREEAEIADVRLHDLRHSYASMALLNGESIRAVGRLLGHERPSTTLKYAHLSDASVREAVDGLAPVLAGGRA
ncbi:MAG: site-specific integrase [Rhodospirillales bacterium]|nr:site-specific integrase [Rhodospirillales bacterium]